jgi:hypothetical protein
VYPDGAEVTVSAEQVRGCGYKATEDLLEGLTVNLHLQYQNSDAEHYVQLLEGVLARLPNFTELIVASDPVHSHEQHGRPDND